MKSIALAAVKVLIVIALLVDGCYLLAKVYPPARLASLVIMGHNTGCSFSRALSAAREVSTQGANTERIRNLSHLVRKDNGLSLWATPYEEYWVPDGSEKFVPFFQLAEQERNVYGTGAMAVHRGDVVFDCGANVGVYTKRALRDGASLVVAIEPSPKNLECLRRNVAADVASGRVIIIPKGVWDRDELLHMHVSRENSAADSFVQGWGDAQDSAVLPLTTVDRIAGELKISRLDLIKLDIEGAEKKALQGARSSLERFHPRLTIAAEHLADDGIAIPATVRRLAPTYTFECGPCIDQDVWVRPDVLYFHAPIRN